jgi:hypothetical protein
MSTKSASKLSRKGQRYNPVPADLRGLPNLKAAAKLALRLKGHRETLDRPENRSKDMSGYHTPGTMKITMNGKYETREGEPVRVLCVDRDDVDYPVVAIVKEYGKWCIYTYTAEGKFSKQRESCGDLVELVDKSAPTKGTPLDTPVWVRDREDYPWQTAHLYYIQRSKA